MHYQVKQRGGKPENNPLLLTKYREVTRLAVRKYSLFVTFLSTVERFFYATILANYHFIGHRWIDGSVDPGLNAGGAWAERRADHALNQLGSNASHSDTIAHTR